MGCCGSCSACGTWGTWVTEGIGGFWGKEDLEELEDLELLVWLAGLEDLGHQPLFLCYKYTFPCLKFVWCVFSLSFLCSVIIIRISFVLVLRSQMSLHVMQGSGAIYAYILYSPKLKRVLRHLHRIQYEHI